MNSSEINLRKLGLLFYFALHSHGNSNPAAVDVRSNFLGEHGSGGFDGF